MFSTRKFRASAALVAGTLLAGLLGSAPARAADPGWLRTPAGLTRAECVHALPAGATFDNGTFVLADGTRQTVPACADPFDSAGSPAGRQAAELPATSGWMYSTWWYAPTWLRRLYANYTVPSAPSKAGALTYIFSSFENTDGNTIAQPVLTYGTSPSGGGDYWYVTSWYVWPGGSVYGGNVRVNPGDTVWGAMEGNTCNSDGTGCHWAIRTVNKSTGGESRIDITSGVAYRWVQGGVLESYGAAGCAMLPASKHIAFSGIQVFGPTFNQLTPDFDVVVGDQQCGMSASATATTTDIRWTVG